MSETKKQKRVRYVTPKGIAVFPWLGKADTKFKPEGQYKITLRLSEEAAKPLIDKLIGELTAPTYDFTSLGKRKVESKADMKARGVPSPNLADCFLLSLAAGIYPKTNPHRRTETARAGSWLAA